MSDITGFAELRPGAFKDELNALLEKKRKMNTTQIVVLFKENVRRYVKENGAGMTEKAVMFPIMGGKIHNMLPETSPAIICTIEALPSVKAAFAKEGIVLEWVYDRGKLNGKLIFRW